jgi:hypothetical protein
VNGKETTPNDSSSSTFVVGFTGHRRIASEEKVAPFLRGVLVSLASERYGNLIGRSSVASGADTLFAEACLDLKLRWIALLPFPEAEFKKDFNEMDWHRAAALLCRADRIETSSGVAERPGGYLQCGLATVEGADVMIALWDGKPSRGPGGTAEIVAHTRLLQKPLILIHPDKLEIQRERFQSR